MMQKDGIDEGFTKLIFLCYKTSMPNLKSFIDCEIFHFFRNQFSLKSNCPCRVYIKERSPTHFFATSVVLTHNHSLMCDESGHPVEMRPADLDSDYQDYVIALAATRMTPNDIAFELQQKIYLENPDLAPMRVRRHGRHFIVIL